jgi:hypothetical protein
MGPLKCKVQGGPAREAPSFEAELKRAAQRRKDFRIVRPDGHDGTQWAVAFSGGGIRSATFCLGVLQGLVKSACPPLRMDGESTPPRTSRDSLLPQFDYVSTVSGGGFIGSFFGSLFALRRLNTSDALTDDQTAAQAYQVFEEEPPGRLRSSVTFDRDAPGKAPLAWLRENGRYMAPTGTGDMVYAAALQIRSWLAMHYVLGTVMLTAFALLGLARAALVDASFSDARWDVAGSWLAAYRAQEISLLASAIGKEALLWWSPIWWLAAPLLVLWIVPCGLAFWLTHPAPGCSVSDPPDLLSKAALFELLAGVVTVALAIYCHRKMGSDWAHFTWALAAAGGTTILGFGWHAGTSYRSSSIASQRVVLTRLLARGLIWLAIVALLAIVDTAAQSLYLHFGQITGWLTSTAALGALVWIVRHLAAAFDADVRKGWLSKIPVDMIITVAGVTLLLLVALFWSMLVLWIQWRGLPPETALFDNAAEYRQVVMALTVAFLLAFGLVLISGRFPGFLNLSTLQPLYSARLTRAYLGGSNGERFGAGKVQLRSVAEPVRSDHLTADEYFRNPLMPIHIINVCVNQNSDPAEQLVQRDRKGKPLAILPAGFALDGTFSAFPAPDGMGEMSARLTIGEWVGVSGAAFSTGLGRGTTLGYSLLMGLANIRLGRWWESGLTSPSAPGLGRQFRKVFKTQAYLLDELFATFYGTRRPLQYLSDGGHFENTAVYELLRPERKIRLIVVCDCGCDPDYAFDDLANLVRLGRIDFSVEIEVDRNVAGDGHLGTIFGTPEEFLPSKDGSSPRDTKCALLLNVFHTPAARASNAPDARIIVLKPRLISGVAADLAQYRIAHPDFPQQPTADQFYDEAQWESYRKLGLEIATRVFGAGAEHGEYRKALWERVLIPQNAPGTR